jgi:RES domain-containing protein
VAVVYASEHLAMAASEKFVHLPKPIPERSRFVRFRLDFGNLAITRIAASELPRGWDDEPPTRPTQLLGDAWVLGLGSAILAVPSVLYPEETNFALNPAHPDFPRIKVSAAEPFSFDPRMARLQEATDPLGKSAP